MLSTTKQIILASSSPRRKEIMTQAGFDFEVRLQDVDESFSDQTPVDQVSILLAERKASAIEVSDNEVLITADTIVLVGDQILNKPSDFNEAVEMLELLSGQKHKVITGVCIKTSTTSFSFGDTTFVTFKELSSSEIEYYIENCQPFDKAGAYGVQEFISLVGITKIEGSYYTVMGLPIHRIYDELTKMDIITYE